MSAAHEGGRRGISPPVLEGPGQGDQGIPPGTVSAAGLVACPHAAFLRFCKVGMMPTASPANSSSPSPPGSGLRVLGWPAAPGGTWRCSPRCQQEGTCKKPQSPASLDGKRAQPEPPVPEPTQTQGHGLTDGFIQMLSPARMKYLLHRLVQDPLQVPHLDADHEGRGAADGVEQALGDHGDVGMSPGEGVEESSHRVDALREDAAGQGAIVVALHEERELHCSEGTSHPELSCILRSFKGVFCGVVFCFFF